MPSNTLFKLFTATTFITAIATGCATAPPSAYPAGINAHTKSANVADAETQRVRGHASIRMNATLLDGLTSAISDNNLDHARRTADAVLTEAHDLANRAVPTEMLRLSDKHWAELASNYFASTTTPDQNARERLTEEFKRESDLEFFFLQNQLAAAKDLPTLRKFLTTLRDNTETSVKFSGRGERQASGFLFAPAAAAIRESVHNDEATCQPDANFEGVTNYSLSAAAPLPNIPHADLLARYSPIFVQETLKHPKYDPNVDRLGLVTATDNADIDVDTSIPSIYAYTRTVLLNGEPHLQLTYVLWYPEHPKLKSGIDAEAGHIDGATVRLTLSSDNKPAIYETLNNCGCHHRLYPSEALEAAAQSAFGSPQKGKSYCIERDADGKYDVIIPGLIRPQDGDHALVRCRAGTHAVVNVSFASDHPPEKVVATQNYQLHDYDELLRLKTPKGKIVSMFEPNGLVRGAERFEGDVFNSLGMLSAGQPRQRGTQLVNWDAYDFDDPHLYEKTIRLPKHF